MKYVPLNYYTINGSEKTLTFFLSSVLIRKEERGGKEVANSESKEEQRKIDGGKK